MATVYVGNLSPEVTDHELHALFAAYGKVRSIRFLRGRGLAFVELKPDAADAAVRALSGSELRGRTLDVAMERAQPGRPRHRPGPRRRR